MIQVIQVSETNERPDFFARSLRSLKFKALEWHWNQVSRIGLFGKTKVTMAPLGPQHRSKRWGAVFPFFLLQSITVFNHLQRCQVKDESSRHYAALYKIREYIAPTVAAISLLLASL